MDPCPRTPVNGYKQVPVHIRSVPPTSLLLTFHRLSSYQLCEQGAPRGEWKSYNMEGAWVTASS